MKIFDEESAAVFPLSYGPPLKNHLEIIFNATIVRSRRGVFVQDSFPSLSY